MFAFVLSRGLLSCHSGVLFRTMRSFGVLSVGWDMFGFCAEIGLDCERLLSALLLDVLRYSNLRPPRQLFAPFSTRDMT